MVSKDLHTRLRVRVIRGFKAEVLDAQFREEIFQEPHEPAEREAEVGNDTLDLVELGQMGGIDGLVAEDTVDGEVAARLDLAAVLGCHASKSVENPGRDGGGVGA